MNQVRFVLSATLLLIVTKAVAGHDIITTNLTYARDISRIFARHCLACHAAGSSIPLSSYEEVRPWAVSIKEQVLRRSMPPWGAVKGFGDIKPDYGLSQEDMMIIAAWVVGGAPKGSEGLLPQIKPLNGGATSKSLSLSDQLVVQTTQKLSKPIQLAGIRPIVEARVDSARLIARLPDGRIEPLLWLYQYDPKFARVFTFRTPLSLPAGTVVESSAPIRFALQCALKAPSAAP